MNLKKPETSDLTNRVVAGYRVLHRLGRGGMSEVYLAFHENLRRHVALKVLRQDLVGSTDHLHRFLQEARAAASLVHPNIVQVYDIGQFENVHFIAQEYIPGSNLRSYIQRKGSLPIPEAMSILIQTTSALQKASSIGIVHRDIKPENILLTSDGEVKVADFGLARARGQDTSLTDVGITLGTPLYMSPEQIQDSSVDSRSDLYSLGVTAFHMLCGRPPFEGETTLALALHHTQTTPPNIEQFRPDAPPALCKIIQTLLAKKPDDRYGSATALLRALRDVAEALPGKWHGDQLLPLSDLVIEHDVELATQTMRLQTAMLKQRKNSAASPYLKSIGLSGLVLASAILGYVVTANWRVQPLIPAMDTEVSAIPRKSSIKEQYFYAMTIGDIPVWKSVEEHFPPAQTPAHVPYNVKAWIQIARLALAQDDLKTAERSIQKILETGGVENEWRSLAKILLMGVEKLRDNRPGIEQARQDAKRYFDSLSDSKKEIVKKNIPSDLLPLWEDTKGNT